ncbi:hypothetical protein ACWIGI_29105 [Nocardia sp. NPDC055321]
MRRTARLLLIGTIATAALMSGSAAASADTAPAEVAGSGSAGSSSGSGAVETKILLDLLEVGSGPSGGIIPGFREFLIDSGSFTRCEIDPPIGPPMCWD